MKFGEIHEIVTLFSLKWKKFHEIDISGNCIITSLIEMRFLTWNVNVQLGHVVTSTQSPGQHRSKQKNAGKRSRTYMQENSTIHQKYKVLNHCNHLDS